MSQVEKSAEDFAQRAFDLNILDQRQLESVWTELGTRNVTTDEFQRVLLRRELLTNYQVERLLRGERAGFFYGEYKVLYLVGTGSFARVYRAVHKDSGKVVAIKVLRKRFSDNAVNTEQFIREGQMGAKLRHPNIVPIFEVHSEKRSHYMIMDFVEGQNLREFVKIRKKLSPEYALKFTTDIVSGLSYAAEFGIRHRDLKLSNVLLSSTGRAQLVDFGLAAVASGFTDEDMADDPNPRTIDYAGLERATGVRKDDPRSDTYFAGCMFYNMLTGTPPLFETKDRSKRLSRSRFSDITPIQELEPNLPPGYITVVRKAMELNADRRYQSPQEFLLDLQKLAKRGDATAADPAASEGANRTVMIVDSNNEMQDVFRKNLKKVGYRVLVVSDAERAIARCDTKDKVADCVVFCCYSLGRTGLDAFNRFAEMETTKDVPAILLLGKKQNAGDNVQVNDKRDILKMPVKMKEFRIALKKLLDREKS